MKPRPLETLRGQSAKEETAITMRSIRDILNDAGQQDALLTATPAQPEQTAPPPDVQQHSAPDDALPDPAPNTGLVHLLKDKLFGKTR